MFTKGLFDTERLRLRLFRQRDFERFLELSLDPEVQKYFKGLGSSVSEISSYFDSILNQDKNYSEAFAISLSKTHTIIGYIGFFSMPPETVNLEYFIATDYRHHSYAKEALKGIMTYIRIYKPEIRYISLIVDKGNIPSQNLLEHFNPEKKDFDNSTYEYVITL